MKAVFCYDGPLYKTENGEYFDTILNNQMFERYFKVADTLEVIIRTRDITHDVAYKRMSKLSNPKISVQECPNLSSVSGLLTQTYNVKKLLEERLSKADIVFIRLPSNIGNLAVDVCKKIGKKYLIEVVGCPWDSYWNYSFKAKLIAPIAKWIMADKVKNAPYVLYVTNEFLQKRYPTKGKSIGCSNVELLPMSEGVLENRIQRIENYSNHTKYIVGTAAGLDVLYKGQQYVIQALGELKKRGITCFEYRLVGGGNGEYLKQIATEYDVLEQVNIIGQLPHDKVFEWMDDLDIYVQPSRQEGLPRAMIEAMSRALPCLGAKTAGIPELIDSEYVFSNSKTEIEEICNLLLMLSENKALMEEIANRNYEEAKKYQKHILVERRTQFFKDFSES